MGAERSLWLYRIQGTIEVKLVSYKSKTRGIEVASCRELCGDEIYNERNPTPFIRGQLGGNKGEARESDRNHFLV